MPSGDIEAALDEAMARGRAWLSAWSTAFDGRVIEPSSPRLVAAAALQHLNLEHHASILLLISSRRLASARALYRPQIEAHSRGLWIRRCASDEQVDGFWRGSFTFPKASVIRKALTGLDPELWGGLAAIQWSLWDRLSDQTHGGLAQVTSRTAANEVAFPFDPVEAIGFLDGSATAALFSAIELADMVGGVDMAGGLLAAFKQLYPIHDDR